MASRSSLLAHAVPAALTVSARSGHTLARRADVLAYFDRPGTSNGPTEAINGPLEHLRGPPPSASETSPYYIAKIVLEPAASDPGYTLDSEEPVHGTVLGVDQDHVDVGHDGSVDGGERERFGSAVGLHLVESSGIVTAWML